MAEHFCVEHQVVFFKKGGMRGFAHPINDRDGQPTGQWCNEPKETEKPPVVESPKQEMTSVMSKDDWREKDKITRKSIERQKSLELATNWAIALLNSSSFTKKESLSSRSIIMAARAYEEYLANGEIPTILQIEKLVEGKEVKPATESRLVKEVKKLGGTEVKEKEK